MLLSGFESAEAEKRVEGQWWKEVTGCLLTSSCRTVAIADTGGYAGVKARVICDRPIHQGKQLTSDFVLVKFVHLVMLGYVQGHLWYAGYALS